MEVLYVCNNEMRRTNMLEAILNKAYGTGGIDSLVKNISTCLKVFNELMNNIFLLLDNIKKIMVFK
ncbi:hypothetical protein LGK97_05380 [Clostridium sp. CS001]|uniref:hypothetical protein n=1 Tax=Clostridium sp. CS001 TaxID=2880648 RepID=UPI001CF4155C|nr:hypothetical protein [Clostridium sp. CS001]MCB2289194.1 hypothetical protein [Clostridium sp. CS001]